MRRRDLTLKLIKKGDSSKTTYFIELKQYIIPLLTKKNFGGQ